jgi:ATP-dependent DNA helicase RecG
LVLTRDPDLSGPHAKELKLLLYLFERDDAVLLMRAG